jgi:hypothetical protein
MYVYVLRFEMITHGRLGDVSQKMVCGLTLRKKMYNNVNGPSFRLLSRPFNVVKLEISSPVLAALCSTMIVSKT